MELGMAPVITSNMFTQLLVGLKVLRVDQSKKEDRMLFAVCQKVLASIITLFQGIALLSSGMYGEVGFGNSMLILMQLLFANVLVMLLDEVLQKGYGIGSAVNLFLATNICGNIVWAAASPSSVISGDVSEFEGAWLALLHGIVWRRDKFTALKQVFYRQYAPNLISLSATLVVFFIVVFLQGLRVDIPVKHQKMRGNTGAYPIRLFYTSNVAAIFQAAFLSNLYFFSQILHAHGKDYTLVSLIGQWEVLPATGLLRPVGGLVYYMSPPASLLDIIFDPIKIVVYIVFTMFACTLFAKLWVDVSGSSAHDVAKKMREQQMVMPGYRDTDLPAVLNRYIPAAAGAGGACIGALIIVADLFGATGSGTGIVIAVTVVFELFEKVCKEHAPAAALFA